MHQVELVIRKVQEEVVGPGEIVIMSTMPSALDRLTLTFMSIPIAEAR